MRNKFHYNATGFTNTVNTLRTHPTGQWTPLQNSFKRMWTLFLFMNAGFTPRLPNFSRCFQQGPVFNSVTSGEYLNVQPPHTARTWQLFCMHVNEGNPCAAYYTAYFSVTGRKWSWFPFVIPSSARLPSKRMAQTVTSAQLRCHGLSSESRRPARLSHKADRL